MLQIPGYKDVSEEFVNNVGALVEMATNGKMHTMVLFPYMLGKRME